nr:uncharacterized protein LOC111413722 [Onthophagus taurus]XP_022900561.1 uncharacterized protein LOC111413722 [Onthophagus taurus]XP_022900562.1 uncharacterized protein LOC111413722 [Onthophagus taurus]
MPEITLKNIKELIQPSIGEDFEIIENNQKLLTAPGEHYGSIMLAVDLTIKKIKSETKESLNLVAKMIPASDMLRDFFDVQVTFKKEISAYLDAIPALISFQKECGVSEDKILDIFPKCYGARINLNNNNGAVNDDAAIILENLKIQGFVTGDRFVGLNLEEAEFIVQDLARFHAVPIAMQVLNKDQFNKKVLPCTVKNGCFDKVPEEVGKAFYNSLFDGVKQVPELLPLQSKIEKLVEEGLQDLINRLPVNPLFGTIVHSDYWLSNTMLLHDINGKPIKNKIVDLQIMNYGSCLRDLVFFLFTSVVNEALDDNYEKLINLYFKSFMANLKDYHLPNINEYTYEEFIKEMDFIGPKEFYHCGFMLKPIMTEKGKVESFENFQSSDWCRTDLLGEAHKRKLKSLVFSYQKRGWL